MKALAVTALLLCRATASFASGVASGDPCGIIFETASPALQDGQCDLSKARAELGRALSAECRTQASKGRGAAGETLGRLRSLAKRQDPPLGPCPAERRELAAWALCTLAPDDRESAKTFLDLAKDESGLALETRTACRVAIVTTGYVVTGKRNEYVVTQWSPHPLGLTYSLADAESASPAVIDSLTVQLASAQPGIHSDRTAFIAWTTRVCRDGEPQHRTLCARVSANAVDVAKEDWKATRWRAAATAVTLGSIALNLTALALSRDVQQMNWLPGLNVGVAVACIPFGLLYLEQVHPINALILAPFALGAGIAIGYFVGTGSPSVRLGGGIVGSMAPLAFILPLIWRKY